MTAYCTQNDLITRFGTEEITANADRDNDGTADAPVVDAAIAAAAAVIDSYIGTKYALPLATTPAAVKRAAEDIARYELFPNEIPQVVTDRRDAAIAWLKDIVAGKAALDVPAPAPADSGQSGDVILLEGSDRLMSREELRKL